MKASKAIPHDTKWVFLKQGTCSRTLCYILNREFGHPMETEEKASDPLAGGIMQQGYQCGQLLGATLAAGAESYQRCGNRNQAIGLAIKATQHILQSFTERAGSPDCYDITESDFTSKWGLTKYLIAGKPVVCFRLADKWAPEAIKAAYEGLASDPGDLPEQPVSCASEVVKKMGGTDHEMAMVAGFAGGVGLSGNGCGALAAAIWMNSLKWCRENPGKDGFNNPRAKETLEVYFKATNYEILCSELCGRRFGSIEEHSEFIKEGGCRDLIDALVSA